MSISRLLIKNGTLSEASDNAPSNKGVLTGNASGGVILEIQLQQPQQSGIDNDANSKAKVVPIDHIPGWRLHKNPFWRVQHPFSNATNTLQHYQPANVTAGSDTYNNTKQQLQHHQNQPSTFNSSVASPPSAVVTYSSSPLYAYSITDDAEIAGQVVLRLPPGKRSLEHLGLKVSFIGRIDVSMGVHEGKPHADFCTTSKELAPPGMIYQEETVFKFRFKNMDLELESYRGRNVAVRYIVHAKLERKFLPPLVQEHEVWMQLLQPGPPSADESIKMEVGIEDCLHIEFSYPRRIYHLRDTIVGRILFLLVRIKIKHMELALIRRETSGDGLLTTSSASASSTGGGGVSEASHVAAAAADSGVNTSENVNLFTETQTLVKYEIMDGAPVKGELIPVQLCLEGVPADLTPTYASVHNRFSVRYFINLVLVDEDDRRYFKQQEITLWRKDIGL